MTAAGTGNTDRDGGAGVDAARVDAAAGLLLAVRAGAPSLVALPIHARPRDEAEAYAVQRAVMRVLGDSTTFKVGAKGGVGPRTCAPIPAGLVFPSPATCALASFGSCILEVEIAYRFGRRLPASGAPHAYEAVRDAIDAIVPAVEIADSRFVDYRDVDRFSQLADNQNCGALVRGAPLQDWHGVDPRGLSARLEIDGETAVDTIGGHKMGDPFPLVHWFANQRALRGIDVAPGTLVTTGSFTGSHKVHAAATVAARLDGVGRIDLSLV